MRNLPVEQISESQRLAPQLPVEPDTKVVQGHFGRQARLKAIQGMRTLPRQPEGIEQLIIDGFNDLAQPDQPAPRRLASRVGMPELSSASYKQCCACICSTRNKLKATMTSR